MNSEMILSQACPRKLKNGEDNIMYVYKYQSMKVYESSTNDRKITIGNLRIINRRRRSIYNYVGYIW